MTREQEQLRRVAIVEMDEWRAGGMAGPAMDALAKYAGALIAEYVLEKTLAALAAQPEPGKRETERLASLLGEIAACGVEHHDRRDGYAVVQIDDDLWDEVRKFAPVPAAPDPRGEAERFIAEQRANRASEHEPSYQRDGHHVTVGDRDPVPAPEPAPETGADEPLGRCPECSSIDTRGKSLDGRHWAFTCEGCGAEWTVTEQPKGGEQPAAEGRPDVSDPAPATTPAPVTAGPFGEAPTAPLAMCRALLRAVRPAPSEGKAGEP